MQRIRIRYKKGEALQYTGNLDLHKVWERTFRRAQLPLAYSQGFHPQPRMHQACPLPLGFTSNCEILDFWCDSEDSLEKIRAMLEKTVQPGIEILTLSSIPLKNPVLQTVIEASDYLVSLDENTDIQDIDIKIQNLLSSECLVRERRGKPYNLRPLIKFLKLFDSNPPSIEMRLSALPGATGRPEEVLEVLGIPPNTVDIKRTALLFSSIDSELLNQPKV
ncbi:MAG: hypothetical protein FD147_70 [Chloroflexi bacterium]|nr:MAG: hypothetical protein FD147_70 [Chloroflexota bacterium]